MMNRTTRFRCTVLACDMSAGTCADRQRDATVSTARNSNGAEARFTPFVSCRNCEQGRAIVAEIGASKPRSQRLLTQAPVPPSSAAPTEPRDRSSRMAAAIVRRAAVARERRLARTHCPQGHEYTGVTDGRGARICRTCVTAATRAWRARRRAA